MAINGSLIGASLSRSGSEWESIPFKKATKLVFRLQARIAKAMREGKLGRVKALQRLLTHSFYAKCLAVKQVTSNDALLSVEKIKVKLYLFVSWRKSLISGIFPVA
ncbi:hypothetical protein EDM53_01535, partial [Rickettsiales endosymbiont of Peranema trichophorum]|uniref:reverse transcriptase N-terminal domain-containing protein n=1 Tax=Rickettsiales endosymbiont of Peranema trichophorum TaxID=2486577 RepID=UPI0010D40E5F